MATTVENCTTGECTLNQHGERQFCPPCYDTLFEDGTCQNCGEDTDQHDGRSPGDIGTGVSDDFDSTRFCSFDCQEDHHNKEQES